MNYKNSASYAKELDFGDPLAKMRSEFFIPRHRNGLEEIYFCGNSLGLQPKRTKEYLALELEKWKTLGVKGHFSGDFPWMPYHEFLLETSAALVGAKINEVTVMNSLTANLHLMMVSFYQPSTKRHKILLEENAFPSDYYAVSSQIKFHGYNPKDSLITVKPCLDSYTSSTEDWLELIETQGDDISLVLLPGVQYLTGQVIDIETITKAAHRKGCMVGADLAHAAGNIELHLHDWQVDFACWCHYKYLNSGPGAVAGCFVHSNHVKNPFLPRFAGWWGHSKETRFLMENNFSPIPTAEGWQLSNPPIFSLAAIRASLDVFKEAGGMSTLCEKSKKLTGFLAYLLENELKDHIQIITPSNPKERGCQLSVVIRSKMGKKLQSQLEEKGAIIDVREPNVLRIAPVPLYNSFQDVYNFVSLLKSELLT